MSVNRIGESLLKTIFLYCLINFFFWTGQLIFKLLTFGYYRAPERLSFVPDRGDGYSGLFLSLASTTVGFTFWLLSFPYLYDFFTGFGAGQ